jgi:CubicO group peptidase (beta-lactamase class C family)
MYKIAILFSCSFLLYFIPSGAQNSTMDTAVQAAASFYMKDTSRVGLSIGILYRGSTSTYHFGSTEIGENKLPSDKTLYEIGSITKTMTGTLLAQAVIDKKAGLQDDIRKYLDSPYTNLEYNGHAIQLVHLLNHSSGLPFMLPDTSELFRDPDYDSLPFILDSIEKDYTKQQFFKDLKKVKIDTIPGIKLKYSNAAAQLLGYLLERIYDMPYENLISKYISEPLNMPGTKLRLSERDKKYLAKGYNSNGLLMPYTRSGTAGGVYATVTDMLNYARFHMDEDNPVVKLSHSPTWGDIRYYAMGLNWQMQDKDDEARKLFQSGGTAGFCSFLILFPELDFAAVLLANESDENSQGMLSETAHKIFNALVKK